MMRCMMLIHTMLPVLVLQNMKMLVFKQLDVVDEAMRLMGTATSSQNHQRQHEDQQVHLTQQYTKSMIIIGINKSLQRRAFFSAGASLDFHSDNTSLQRLCFLASA